MTIPILTLSAQDPGLQVEQGALHTDDGSSPTNGGFIKVGSLTGNADHLSIDPNGIQTMFDFGGQGYAFRPLRLNPLGGGISVNHDPTSLSGTIDVMSDGVPLYLRSSNPFSINSIWTTTYDGDPKHIGHWGAIYGDDNLEFSTAPNNTEGDINFRIGIEKAVTIKNTTKNVGIGIDTPSQALDVNGNIQTNGQLIPNGVAGSEGQMLQAQSNGGMAWVEPCGEFNNGVCFGGSFTIETWSIPQGIDMIMVEIWGGGGRGDKGGGGGSGGYTRRIYEVGTNTSATYQAGYGATSSGAQGLPSEFTLGGIKITANGGYSASTVNPGQRAFLSDNNATFACSGTNGEATTAGYSQIDSDTYITQFKYGCGGNTPFIEFSTGGSGGFLSFSNDSSVSGFSSVGRRGSAPGGGGGGNNGTNAVDGGQGLVKISWK